MLFGHRGKAFDLPVTRLDMSANLFLSDAASKLVTNWLSLRARISADGSEKHGGKKTTCDCAKSKGPGLQRVPTAHKLLT